MQKIITNLWYQKGVEEAVQLYIDIFGNGKILTTTHYGASAAEVSGQPEGSVLTVEFELFGQRFVGINGGPIFKFTEAMSLQVDCEDQAEIDKYWEALTADGGQESQCGWLKDKYGLSWQIVPKQMTQMMTGDPKKVEAAMKAMLSMQKLDLATLQAAYDAA